MVSLDLYSIGERVFYYNLALAIISSFIAAALISSGAPPSMLNLPIFIGSAVYFNMLGSTLSNLPVTTVNGTWVVTDVNAFTAALTTAGALAIFANILVQTFAGMLNLMTTILLILPAELRFLVPPVVFVFSLLQLAVSYYLFQKIREIVSSVIYVLQR